MVSEKKRATNDKYNAKCDSILLRPLKPVGEKIREAAKESGKSLQGYILDAVAERITVDECGPEIPPDVLAKSIEWLKNNGHTDAETVEFLRYIGKN